MVHKHMKMMIINFKGRDKSQAVITTLLFLCDFTHAALKASSCAYDGGWMRIACQEGHVLDITGLVLGRWSRLWDCSKDEDCDPNNLLCDKNGSVNDLKAIQNKCNNQRQCSYQFLQEECSPGFLNYETDCQLIYYKCEPAEDERHPTSDTSTKGLKTSTTGFGASATVSETSTTWLGTSVTVFETSTTVFETSTTLVESGGTNTEINEGNKLGAGAMAGISLGICVGFIIAITVIILVVRNKKKNTPQEKPEKSITESGIVNLGQEDNTYYNVVQGKPQEKGKPDQLDFSNNNQTTEQEKKRQTNDEALNKMPKQGSPYDYAFGHFSTPPPGATDAATYEDTSIAGKPRSTSEREVSLNPLNGKERLNPKDEDVVITDNVMYSSGMHGDSDKQASTKCSSSPATKTQSADITLEDNDMYVTDNGSNTDVNSRVVKDHVGEQDYSYVFGHFNVKNQPDQHAQNMGGSTGSGCMYQLEAKVAGDEDIELQDMQHINHKKRNSDVSLTENDMYQGESMQS